jgi:hypothetical protein
VRSVALWGGNYSCLVAKWLSKTGGDRSEATAAFLVTVTGGSDAADEGIQLVVAGFRVFFVNLNRCSCPFASRM